MAYFQPGLGSRLESGLGRSWGKDRGRGFDQGNNIFELVGRYVRL